MTADEVSTTTGAAAPDITGYADSQGETVYELGPYRCTDGLSVDLMSDVLSGFFSSSTDSSLKVYTTYLVLNLHAAGSVTAPGDPASAVTGADLPNSASERPGDSLQNALASYLYTPAQLAKDRSDLNESWYKVESSYLPATEYFTVHVNESGKHSTPDGWPSSKYIQLAKSDRVLIEYGSVDPQLADLDLSEEEDMIFSPGYMTSGIRISDDSNGTLTSGCLYSPKATDVAQANSSWAISSRLPIPNNLPADEAMGALSREISSIAECGLSPMLNSSLFGETADVNIANYRNVSLSASWAWAVGETPWRRIRRRHQRATNCSEIRRGACRVDGGAFTWTVSDAVDNFYHIAHVCPPGSALAVPRTGLENTYLYNHLLAQPSDILDPAATDPALREVFLGFNSIDVTSCWVQGGPQATCPYESNPQQLERRAVLVAAIASIVICIIAALTIFVKCNANRRNSRRQKRVIEGWEYEGVPS
ncbi:hypothetical protein N7468_008407 [Penicillium chermesinum]|uniref:Maintenance of telomere capping protein 6 n=1 Tax=Penicillium chermesinum TaxID=63820 RepID=A0A9W9TJU4_9EURO|nr:uncharacterized protein N7468_008407 [Penicillium chermesinum]KAJ5223865.1 hypothetical protein N7468_008407 [Penicillium chermesinum]